MERATEDSGPGGTPLTGSAAEPVEFVERDGTVLGVVTRAEMRARRLRHRSVFVAVRDGRGRLLVHRRADHKDAWPGWWDVSVGGVLAPGEDWRAGAERELAEELGVSGAALTEIGGGVYEDAEVMLLARCYVVESDGPFDCPDGEITETRWVEPGELERMLRSERFLPDGLALVLPRLDDCRGVMP